MSSSSDSAPTADGVVGLSHRQIQIVFTGLMAGMLLASLDQTVVSTALPTIVGELGGLEHLSWVITAYLLTSCSSMLLYGKLSDLYGRKLLFQIAICIFLVGSLLSGVAHSMLQLVLFRGIQGLGAGGIITMSQAVIGDIVAPRRRGPCLLSIPGYGVLVGGTPHRRRLPRLVAAAGDAVAGACACGRRGGGVCPRW